MRFFGRTDRVTAVKLETGLSNPGHAEGLLFYDAVEKCVSYYNEVTGVTVNLGQEQHIRSTNKTGAPLLNGEIVYVDGAQGQRPTIAKAQANAMATSEGTIGVVTADIADNATGYVTTLGLVHDVDTSAHVEGTVLYLSTTTPGAWTAVRPTGTDHVVILGVVTYQHAVNGHILVTPRYLGTPNPTLTGLSGDVIGSNPTLHAALSALDTQSFKQQTIFNGLENKAAFAVVFNANTQTFTVTYTGNAYVRVNGTRYTKTGSEQIVLPLNNSGKWYLYYNSSGVLTVSQTEWDLLTTAPLMLMYYRSSDNRAILFDERHPAGAGFSDAHHKNQHEYVGTLLSAGAVISGYTLNSNAGLQYQATSATLADEDLEMTTAALASNGIRHVFWVDGASGSSWNWSDSAYGILSSAGEGGLPGGNIRFNDPVGATLTNVIGNGTYVNYWPIALPYYATVSGAVQTAKSPGYGVIVSQTSYANLAAAQAVDPRSLLYVSNLTTEGNVFARLTYVRTAGTIRLAADPVYYRQSINTLSTNTFNPTDHQTLTNRNAIAAHPASSIDTTASTFGGTLSPTDTDVKLALETLDKKAAGRKAVLDSNDRTLTEYESYLEMDASGGAKLVGLPAAPFTGYTVTVLKSDSSANTVTINATVNGINGPTLDAQWDRLTVIYNGSAWRAI